MDTRIQERNVNKFIQGKMKERADGNLKKREREDERKGRSAAEEGKEVLNADAKKRKTIRPHDAKAKEPGTDQSLEYGKHAAAKSQRAGDSQTGRKAAVQQRPVERPRLTAPAVRPKLGYQGKCVLNPHGDRSYKP